MPKAARGKPVAVADRERFLDRLAEAVERDDDVLAHLAAALRVHCDRDSLAPAPELLDRRWLGRRVDGNRSLGKDI